MRVTDRDLHGQEHGASSSSLAGVRRRWGPKGTTPAVLVLCSLGGQSSLGGRPQRVWRHWRAAGRWEGGQGNGGKWGGEAGEAGVGGWEPGDGRAANDSQGQPNTRPLQRCAKVLSQRPKAQALASAAIRVPELRSSLCTSPSFFFPREPISRWSVEDRFRRGLIYLLYLDRSAGGPGRLRRGFSVPLGSHLLSTRSLVGSKDQRLKEDPRSTANPTSTPTPTRTGGLYRLGLQTADCTAMYARN